MKINAPITTLIWDLDGTLLDSFGIFEEVLAKVLPAYQRQLPAREIVLANFHGSLEDSIRTVLDGVDDVELAAIIQDFLTVQNSYYDVIEHHLYPDALSFARQAHAAGKRQILVTNREHSGRLQASPRSIVANSELKDYIDVVICGDDSEHRKPKPAVLGSHRFNGEEIMVLGDQHVDAEFAVNLGAQAVVVARHNYVHEARMAYIRASGAMIVSSFDELTVA